MYNPRVKALILEVVDNQINDNDPVATKETLNRLVDSGYEKSKAKEMIAAVLIEEMFPVLKYQQPFDEKKYVERLNQLALTPPQDDKVGRNELCPCGSGKKYKKCCGQ